MNLDTTELEELILTAYGYSEDEKETMFNTGLDLEDFLHGKLMETHDGGIESFLHDFISRLMPLCTVGQSPLTKNFFKGFGIEKNGVERMICRIEIDEKYD